MIKDLVCFHRIRLGLIQYFTVTIHCYNTLYMSQCNSSHNTYNTTRHHRDNILFYCCFCCQPPVDTWRTAVFLTVTRRLHVFRPQLFGFEKWLLGVGDTVKSWPHCITFYIVACVTLHFIRMSHIVSCVVCSIIALQYLYGFLLCYVIF